MGTSRARSADLYIALVILAGGVITVGAAVSEEFRRSVETHGFWVLAILVLLGEVFPISIPRRGGAIHEITASTAFTFTLLIAYGAPAAIVTQVIASVIPGILVHKGPRRIAFDGAQYAVSLGAAGLIYFGSGGTMDPGAGSVMPFVLAALIYFFLTTTITDVAWVPQGIPLDRYLWKDLLIQAQATLPLLALAPVVVSAIEESVWLAPLAAVPVVAVWWGTHLALDNARLANQLQDSLDHEKELSRTKDEFVAVVSHELRTPLTSIQGYIKTMLQLSVKLPEEQRRSFLEAADRQSDRLRRLIEQLLIVGRLEGSADALTRSWVDMDRLAAEVVDELRARANGHTFDVRIPEHLPPLYTDEGKLHQILSNLVENALKYAPPDTRITIGAEPGVDGVVVRVLDEGGGIPQDVHDRIFERFFQVDQSATRRVGGTGLGLYICRRMAEAIGGELSLVRSDDAGSEFSLLVPTAALPGAEPGDRQSMTASV